MTKRITPPAGQPLSVAVEGEILVVKIGIATLAHACQGGDDWPDEFRVDDLDAFARSVAAELQNEEEDGTTLLHRAFDQAAERALNDGRPGFDDGDPEDGLEMAQKALVAHLPAHVEEVRGVPHRQDAKGGWLPEENFRPADLIQDDLVRETIAAAKARAGGLSEFRDDTLARVAEFQALLDQEYGVEKGGAKGNVTLTTIHPTMRMEVRVNELIVFGPELKQAKALIDECLSEWAADAHAIIRALVLRAFNVEKEGHANRGELLGLMRMEVDDARWQRAMKAIRDSIRVDGTKTYVRFQERDTIEGVWRTISLDIARA